MEPDRLAGQVARAPDGEWIERKFLREANVTVPPDGVSDSEQWIDVDRDEQVE